MVTPRGLCLSQVLTALSLDVLVRPVWLGLLLLFATAKQGEAMYSHQVHTADAKEQGEKWCQPTCMLPSPTVVNSELNELKNLKIERVAKSITWVSKRML